MAAKLTRLTHKNSDTIAPSGRELYHLQLWLQETFGYTFVIRLASFNVSPEHESSETPVE
jgi:hypothetical protein